MKLTKWFWTWDHTSKPEWAVDIRVSAIWWLRLFYFRYRPLARRLDPNVSRDLPRFVIDTPKFYEDDRYVENLGA